MKTRVLCLSLLISTIPISTIPASAFEPEPAIASQILWMDAGATRAMFIPEAVFAQTELDQLPISTADLARLELKLAGAASAQDPPSCDYPHDVGPQGSDPDAASLEGNIALHDLSFTGTVVALVDGWSTWGVAPEQMVYVEVDEIVRDAASDLWVGKTVAYSQQPSSLSIDGHVLCAETRGGFGAASVGESVFIVADRFTADDRFVEAWMALPVFEGQVYPKPYPRLQDEQPRSLSELTSFAGEKEATR